jgi:hypothetical protein
MPINALALPVGGRQIGQLLGAASGRSDRVTCVERSSDQFAAQPSRRPCDEPNLELHRPDVSARSGAFRRWLYSRSLNDATRSVVADYIRDFADRDEGGRSPRTVNHRRNRRG